MIGNPAVFEGAPRRALPPDSANQEDLEARFQATFDQAAVGIAHVDLDGRIQLANRRLSQILGYTNEELVGRRVREISHPEDRDLTNELRAQMYAGAIGEFSCEKRYLRNGGAAIWIELTVSLVRDADGAPRYDIAVFEDVTEKKDAQQALRESERRFRTLTRLSSDWFWECDERMCFSYVSPGYEEQAGITIGEVTGRPPWETGVTPINFDWAQLRRDVDARAPFRDLEYLRVSGDGSRHYLKISGAPMFDDAGAFKGYRGVGRNIGERKRAEEELKRFRAALDISADAIYLVDVASMCITDLNDAAGHNLGYTREELLGREASVIFGERTAAELRARYQRQAESESGHELVRAIHRRKDGSLVPVEVTRRLLRTPEATYMVGVARDLTERLRDEERLRASHERFEIVSRATNDVVWDRDLATDQMWWNENFQAVFGYLPAEIGAYVASWTDRIHPDDLAAVKASVCGAIERGEKSWSMEYRFRRKDGGYAHVFDRGLLIQDRHGQPARMIGAMVDISERKRAEQRIALHARRQEGVARLGQLALGRLELTPLFDEALRALRDGGVDAAALYEFVGGEGEYVVRAASGGGSEAFVGQAGRAAEDSRWRSLSLSAGSVSADRPYLASRPDTAPAAWVRGMGSGLYVVLHGDDGAYGVLVVYALLEHAFAGEDRRFVEAVGTLLSTALQRHQAEARLAFLAQFDSLTGLPNRNLFNDRLGQAMVQAARRGGSVGALFVDLDRFKLINDSLGHHAGDALIVKVAQRLQACVRAGDTVGRISGDEFAVVLSDLVRSDDAALVARKMLESLESPFDLGGNEVFVTASIGIAISPADGEHAEVLLQNADAAMYRAKENGRNTYCFFTVELNRRSQDKMRLANDLRRAVERREFVLHYQPKIDLGSRKVCGSEALLRWQHPERGMVSPAEFIPALEDTGLIVEVGDWVIREACRQLARWRDAGLAPVPVAVNLSARQFRSRELEDTIRAHLDASGIPATLLEVEITESCLVENPEEAVRVLERLRAIGVRISVDDFGTGYSSLAYLTRFPLSTLKIDHAFVRNLPADDNAAAIVRTIIDMAHTLRFTVVAEGVETEAQAAFLRAHGCEQGQGFLFARPAPGGDIAGLLQPAAAQPR